MPIIIQTEDKEIKIRYKEKILISSLLEKLDLKLDKPCGGKGICGKCKVIAKGKLSELTNAEKRLLSKKEISNNIRLACSTHILGNATIKYIRQINQIEGITFGQVPSFTIDPLSGDKKCYGIAIDIGTTTIAGYLFKFPESQLIKSISLPNTQMQFGADVISRIEYVTKNGLDKLQKEVNKQINKIKEAFGQEIETYVITGNTIMLHLYTGLDPSQIALHPFTPKSLFGEWKGNIYLPRCISGYIGADITVGILASGLLDMENSFLLDVGTNGEMAYWDGKDLVTCSTAAGPAFEAAGIKYGMPAKKGAIDKVSIYKGQVYYTTIGNTKAVGICGSGVIDAIACMLDLGVMDKTGYIEEDFEIADSGIYIKLSDVRAIQLAKAAIRAGIDTLLKDTSAINKFYMAGGFGNYLDKESCIKIGLIPKEIKEKTKVIGNSAGIGASMILQSKQCLKKSEKIGQIAKAIELSHNDEFMEKYISNINF